MHLEPNEKRCKRRIFNEIPLNWNKHPKSGSVHNMRCNVPNASSNIYYAYFNEMKWNGMKMKKNAEESGTLFPQKCLLNTSTNTHTQTVVQLVENIFCVRKSQRMRGSYLLWQWNRIYLCAVQMRENCFSFLLLLNYKNTVKCVNNAITFRTNAPSGARYGLSSSIFSIFPFSIILSTILLLFVHTYHLVDIFFSMQRPETNEWIK